MAAANLSLRNIKPRTNGANFWHKTRPLRNHLLARSRGDGGEVYRARDTRLDRTVAVKILPAHLSDNPEAKRRFEREARAIWRSACPCSNSSSSLVLLTGYIAPIGYPYDVAPDGQRFIANTSPESVSAPLVLVTNWTADPKK